MVMHRNSVPFSHELRSTIYHSPSKEEKWSDKQDSGARQGPQKERGFSCSCEEDALTNELHWKQMPSVITR